MPADLRISPRLRLAFGPAIFFSLALGLTGRAQPPEKAPDPPKDSKTAPFPKEAPGVRLPDGTFLRAGDGDGRVALTALELQKLQDQIDRLKKQLDARKAVPPSGCAIQGRVDRRGDHVVAEIKITYAFRTSVPGTAVALGGRKGFLVSASLDGNKLPVLETGDDGFAALIEDAGDHSLVIDLEAPVSPRGAKPEVGFEIGLPRSAITTLLLEPPGRDVKRVNVTTRTPDPAVPARPESRRLPALDVKHLAARPGQENGYPLGPIDSLEVTWDPPAASVQPADRAQSAEIDVGVLLTEGFVETTAKFKLRGPAREWMLVAPPSATVSAERALGAADAGPIQPPAFTKPANSNKTEWKVNFPAGSSPADWTITAVTRQIRAKPDDARHRGPFPVGPFAVLDVLRQTGTVRLTASPHTRFVFKHGPDMRRAEPPGPVEDDLSSAFFRLTTGPTGNTVVNAPLFTVEAIPLSGRVAVTPAYKLVLTEAGWKVRAELHVIPIRTEIDSLAVEVPAAWRGLEPSPAEVVEGIQQSATLEGFWSAAAARLLGSRVPVLVRLAAVHKQPFDLILTATVPVPAGSIEAFIPFPRFPRAIERDATVTATVPEGLALRGEVREWDGEQSAAWGTPLSPTVGLGGKTTTSVTGRSDTGLSGVQLAWPVHRPDLTVEVRVDATVFDRQLVVQQVVRLHSPAGLPRPLKFRGPPSAAGLRVLGSQTALEPLASGEWNLTVPKDVRDFTFTVSFAIPLSPLAADRSESWTIPVGLLWPADATRCEATVRIWSKANGTVTLVPATATGWRELPAEPVPDCDALPALVLSTTRLETPLILAAHDVGDSSSVAVWVERGLVQAWALDDGQARYRARFLLRRWLAPAMEVRLPGPVAGAPPEFLRDGLRIDAMPVSDEAGGRTYRIPLAESRPGRGAIIEVRYQLPAGHGDDAEFHPPVLVAAAFTGPVRWQVTVPQGTVPILTAGGTSELRWRWRGLAVAPHAVGNDDELDRWLRDGEEPGGTSDTGDSVTARQTAPQVLTVHRLPRIAFVVACSVAVFVLFLALVRIPPPVLGPVLVLMAGVMGVAAISLPHAAAQVAAGCQPGLLAVVAVIAVQAAIRWTHRRRVTHLPGFARSVPAPSAAAAPVLGTSTSRNRPVAVGSSGGTPLSPAGG